MLESDTSSTFTPSVTQSRSVPRLYSMAGYPIMTLPPVPFVDSTVYNDIDEIQITIHPCPSRYPRRPRPPAHPTTRATPSSGFAAAINEPVLEDEGMLIVHRRCPNSRAQQRAGHRCYRLPGWRPHRPRQRDCGSSLPRQIRQSQQGATHRVKTNIRSADAQRKGLRPPSKLSSPRAQRCAGAEAGEAGGIQGPVRGYVESPGGPPEFKKG